MCTTETQSTKKDSAYIRINAIKSVSLKQILYKGHQVEPLICNTIQAAILDLFNTLGTLETFHHESAMAISRRCDFGGFGLPREAPPCCRPRLQKCKKHRDLHVFDGFTERNSDIYLIYTMSFLASNASNWALHPHLRWVFGAFLNF